MKVDVVNVVWGTKYTDLLLRVTMPNTMSAGNFGAVGGDPDWRYRLYTTPEDARVIRASPTFAQLQQLITTELVEVPNLGAGNHYEHMTGCHRNSLESATSRGAAVIFLAPDVVWSDGTMRRLREHIEAGVPMVVTSAVRVRGDTFVPALEAQTRDADGAVAPLGSRQLVDLALHNLHPRSASVIWDSPGFSSTPSVLYWRVPATTGIVQRCFHLHPLMVQHLAAGLAIDGTIDGSFIEHACPDVEAIHVVVDSDEIAGCSINDPHDDGDEVTSRHANVVSVACWATAATNRHHRAFVRRAILFHAEELDAGWQPVLRRSDEVVGEILRLRPWLVVPCGCGRMVRQLGRAALPARMRSVARRWYRRASGKPARPAPPGADHEHRHRRGVPAGR